LLELAVVTGAAFDAFANPDLLLDRDRRHSCRDLARKTASTLMGTFRFLEEMALVGGMTPDQVASAQVTSNAAHRVLSSANADVEAGKTVSFKQVIPREAMTTSWMPYLSLAGQRAGVPVQLAPNIDHALKFEISLPLEELAAGTELSFVELKPVSPNSVGLFLCQARLVVDAASKTVRIDMKSFLDDSGDRWSVSLLGTVPTSREDGTSAVKFSVSLRWPLVTIGDLESIRQVALIDQEGDARVQMFDIAAGKQLSDQPLSAWSCVLVKYLPDWANQDVLESLLTVDPTLPVPVLIPGEKLKEIARVRKDEWLSSWRAFIEKTREDQPDVTSFSFAFVGANGDLAYHEFLAFSPGRLTPVRKPGGDISQAEIDQIVQDGTEISVFSYVCEDMFRVAERLREWIRDGAAPFPPFLQAEPGISPVALTRVDMICLPVVDRTWHQEWPIRIELRLASLREKLEQELAYWIHINDDRRAELVRERLSELDAAS